MPIASSIVGAFVGGQEASKDIYKEPFTSMTKIVVEGVAFGVIGDAFAPKFKDNWAKTDVEKNL